MLDQVDTLNSPGSGAKLISGPPWKRPAVAAFTATAPESYREEI